MKNGRLALILSLGAFVGIGGTTALAHPGGPGAPGPRGPGGPGPRCMPPHIRAQLPSYDLNKNGKLEPEEHRAMREAQRAADLAQYDADKDGKLSKRELDNLHRDKMVEHFELLDTNADAEISKEEAKNSCTPLEHHFDEVDADGNGLVSWEEFEKAAPKGPPHRGPRPPRGPRGKHGPGGSCSEK